jgi:uncharacterized membrane protein YidH (DUF202 family)
VAKQSLQRSGEKLAESAEKIKRSTYDVEDSAERTTQLAADRTVFAAERTYAAWVRTGLFAMASGIGAKALLSGLIPEWLNRSHWQRPRLIQRVLFWGRRLAPSRARGAAAQTFRRQLRAARDRVEQPRTAGARAPGDHLTVAAARCASTASTLAGGSRRR